MALAVLPPRPPVTSTAGALHADPIQPQDPLRSSAPGLSLSFHPVQAWASVVLSLSLKLGGPRVSQQSSRVRSCHGWLRELPPGSELGTAREWAGSQVLRSLSCSCHRTPLFVCWDTFGAAGKAGEVAQRGWGAKEGLCSATGPAERGAACRGWGGARGRGQRRATSLCLSWRHRHSHKDPDSRLLLKLPPAEKGGATRPGLSKGN